MIRGIFKTTSRHRRYWKNRKIDWGKAYFNPDHPHRKLILEAVRDFMPVKSILELGCAAGANIYNIKKAYPFVDVGGIDWSADAIEEAKRWLPKVAVLQQGEATDVYISQGGADMILTDMTYIYLSKKHFRKALKEARRIARVGVILCEFNEPKWWRRLGIRFATGYNAYNYKKELELAGFHDISIRKLTPQDWPETEKENGLRCIITARS